MNTAFGVVILRFYVKVRNKFIYMYTYICVFTLRLYVCFIVQRTQHKNSFLVFNVLSISPPVSFSKKKKERR